jgi:hypothetical protein
LAVLSFATAAGAQHLAKGFVLNSDGVKCWFTQSAEETRTPFSESSKLTANTRTLVFDSPTCMPVNRVNISSIASAIARPYSHGDASWSRDFRLGDALGRLDKEYCIQSANYRLAGVMYRPVMQDAFIVRVIHHAAPGGCGSNSASLDGIPPL